MKRRNKKAMLANLIAGFMVLMVGLTIVPMIFQEINNLSNCGSAPVTEVQETIPVESAPGATDSFGGGGAAHFGGYDGKLEHKSFTQEVASYSIVKTDKSYFRPNCGMNVTSASQDLILTSTLFNFLPGLFALIILGTAIIMVAAAFRNSGLSDGEL